eukprot:TRINITY_DN10794_c0_g1_i1.p1 TRINITY_DN10794_c0_g1~~TRINITY_DN10794_c0_g1_i1.p1  ORF type:complete len:227 (-),score=46.54 TRINITY_DN10794_c0_g1_i1:267-869(-)
MILRPQFLSALFCLTLAVFQGVDGQVLELFNRVEAGGGQGPVILCPVDMNQTYPGGYCAEFVDYRYCPACSLPQPNSDNMVWVIGEEVQDAVAEAAYHRIVSSVRTKRPTVTDQCLRTAQAMACYFTYMRAADDTTRLAWNTPCRSVCYEIKNTCWVQESCQNVPAGGCTAKSVSSAVRPLGLLSLLLVAGLLSLPLVLS